MNNNKIHPLDVLRELKQSRKREVRSTSRFLKDPEAEQASGWYFPLPKAFNKALDIRKTDRVIDGQKVKAWSQGSYFTFDEGDLLVSGGNADIWGKSFTKETVCLQVVESLYSMPATDTESRYSGEVTLKIFRPDDITGKPRYCGMTVISQDALIEYLITGQNSQIKRVLDEDAEHAPPGDAR